MFSRLFVKYIFKNMSKEENRTRKGKSKKSKAFKCQKKGHNCIPNSVCTLNKNSGHHPRRALKFDQPEHALMIFPVELQLPCLLLPRYSQTLVP
jgi:hypothetical protein